MELEVYSQQSNGAVVKPPGRNYPGVVIQGDSLYVLYSEALEVLKALRDSQDDEPYYAARELAENLETHLNHYSQVLREHGIELPFVRTPRENVAMYKRQDDLELCFQPDAVIRRTASRSLVARAG